MQTQLLLFLDQKVLFDSINFQLAPFHPYLDAKLGPNGEVGANGTAARTVVSVFLCPSDFKRAGTIWAANNYRACNGSDWSGRSGNGLFGQNGGVSIAGVTDGLATTAAMAERCRSWAPDDHIELRSVLVPNPNLWTNETFRDWCGALTVEEAAALTIDNKGGLTWLEGNTNWTRYNHLLPPNRPSCKNGLTWNGVAMTASSRHPGGVHLLLGDGAVRFVRESVDPSVWSALATIRGGETISSDAF